MSELNNINKIIKPYLITSLKVLFILFVLFIIFSIVVFFMNPNDIEIKNSNRRKIEENIKNSDKRKKMIISLKIQQKI